jgi:tetratricopeptide (TPR) repeat protein
MFAIGLVPVMISCSGGNAPPALEPRVTNEAEMVVPEDPESARLAKAIDECSTAITQNPQAINDEGRLFIHERGILHFEKGESDKALNDLTEAIRLYPLVDHPESKLQLLTARDSRGSVYLSNCDYENAMADFTQVIQQSFSPTLTKSIVIRAALGNNIAAAYFKLGVCCQEKNDLNKAKHYYETAVNLQPRILDSEEAKKRLQPLMPSLFKSPRVGKDTVDDSLDKLLDMK